MDNLQEYLSYIRNILKVVDNYTPIIDTVESKNENILDILKTVSHIDELMRISEYGCIKDMRIKNDDYLHEKIAISLKDKFIKDVNDIKDIEKLEKCCGSLLDEQYLIKDDAFQLYTMNPGIAFESTIEVEHLIEKGLSKIDIKLGNTVEKFGHKIDEFYKIKK